MYFLRFTIIIQQLLLLIIPNEKRTKVTMSWRFVSRKRNKFVWHFPSIPSILALRHFFSEGEKALEQVQRFLRNADWKLLARPRERFKIREKHRVKSIEVVRRLVREDGLKVHGMEKVCKGRIGKT